MTGETVVTIIGRLTSDVELRFTASGQAVANLTIASNPRTFDKTTNEWKDGPALFMRCTAWKQMAENVTESLVKGMRVIAQGRLTQRSYEKDGEKRTVIEMTLDEIGPGLSFATARVATVARPAGGGASSGGGAAGSAVQDDPWAGGTPYPGEAPF